MDKDTHKKMCVCVRVYVCMVVVVLGGSRLGGYPLANYSKFLTHLVNSYINDTEIRILEPRADLLGWVWDGLSLHVVIIVRVPSHLGQSENERCSACYMGRCYGY